MQSPTSPRKKLRSPSQESIINPKTSVTCTNVPDSLFDSTAARKHFSKFGRYTKIRLFPKRHMCIVDYDQQSSAEKAVLNAGAYDGFMFDVTRSKARMRRRSIKKDDDPDWVPDSDVEDELSAMGETPTYVTRQNAINVDPDIKPLVRPLKSKASPRVMKQSLKKKLPIREKKSAVSQPAAVVEAPLVVTTQTTMTTSEAAAELYQLRSKVSVTPDEQWRILDARDRILRAWGGAGSRIKVGGATIGTCQDMCPEKELLHRQAEHQVMTLETVMDSDGELEPWRAVKQYSRSSADQEIPMCYELRPAHVLMRTCSYLLHEIADTKRQVSLADWFHFMWDRFRSIRKDITQQALCCTESICLVEMCARFHAHCAARLADLEHTQFDQKLNTDNLTKCLQTLKHMYADVGPEVKPREAEFRGYVALLNLGDANFWWEIKQLPIDIQKSAPIIFAIKVFNAIDNNNYVRFFRLVREEASYLQACILLRYFNDVRARALARIVKAYAPRGGSRYPAEELMNSLAFESIENLKSFINHYGLRFARTDDGEGEIAVILDRNQFIEDSDPYPTARAIKLIESKRRHSVGETIAGGNLPDYSQHRLYSSFTPDGRLKETALIAEDQQYNTLNDSNKDINTLKMEIQKLSQGGKPCIMERVVENKPNLFVKPDPTSLSQKATVPANPILSKLPSESNIFSFKPAIPVASSDIIKNSPEKIFSEDTKKIFSFSPPQESMVPTVFAGKEKVKSLFENTRLPESNLFKQPSSDKSVTSNSLFAGTKSDDVFKKPEGKTVFKQSVDNKPVSNLFTASANKNIFSANEESKSDKSSLFPNTNLFVGAKTDLFSKPDSTALFDKSGNIFSKPAQPVETDDTKRPSNIFGNFSKQSESNNLFIKPGNTSVFTKPEGNIFSIPEGTNVFSKPEGTNVFSKPEGTNVFSKPEGTNVFSKPEGINVFSKPEGTNVFSKPEGTNVFSKPEGTNVFNKPETSVFGKSEGTSLFNKPEGTNVFNKTEATNVFTKPEGTNIFNKQEGSTVFNKPEGTNVFSKPVSSNLFTKPAESNIFSKPADSNLFTKPGTNLFTKSENTNIFTKPETSNVFNSNESKAQPQTVISNGETNANTNLSPGTLFKSVINPPNGPDSKTYSIFQSKNKAQTVADNILNSVITSQSSAVYEFNQNENQDQQEIARQRLNEALLKEEERKMQEKIEKERRRQEELTKQEMLRKEEERRNKEARKKQEELRLLEERRKKEEQRKQEELRKKLEEEKQAELRRKAEEERKFKERVEKDSQELVEELIDEINNTTVRDTMEEELEDFNNLIQYANTITNEILENLSIEICESEMKAEVHLTRNIMRKWFDVWKTNCARNKKRRNLLEDTPVWLPRKTPCEEASLLRRFVEKATLKNMNAIHKGYKFSGELKPLPTPEAYNIMEIIRSPLLKRMKQICYPYDKCFFWKITLVSPGAMKWLHRKINIEKWILDVFHDNKRHEVSNTLIHVGKQSWNHLMDFAISVSLKTKDKTIYDNEAIDGTNAVLFYATETDNDLAETIETTLKHKYPYQIVPVAVIIPKIDALHVNIECILRNLVNAKVISTYRVYVVDSQNIFESLNANTKSAMKWLAKNYPQLPPLEIDNLKSICQRYLGNEIWCRLRSETDNRMNAVLRDLYKLIKCYNIAVDKLTDVITNENLFNYSSFPLEFQPYLDHTSPYPKPFEFIPSSVKTSENVSAIKRMMNQLKLPDPTLDFNPVNAISMQQQMTSYCSQIGWFENPEEVVCKVVAVLPNELSNVCMPREEFNKYFAHYNLVDFMNIIIYEKINSLKNFENRFAIYEKSVLEEYRNALWLYDVNVIQDMKHKALEYEDELDFYLEAKRRKVELDSLDYLMLEDKDRTLVDESIHETDKSISQLNDCTEAVKQLEWQIEEGKKKSIEFENLLKAALGEF